MRSLINATSDRIPLPDNSIHLAITSPPYWSLRHYSGLEPMVWGGQPDCEHIWHRDLCQRCGAWRGHLGNEPDPFLYIEHMVDIFREVCRVLRPGGTFILNISDSYMGSGGAHTHDHANPGISNSASRDGYRSDGGRRSTKKAPGLKAKDKALIPERLIIALQEDGWFVRQAMQWIKTNGLVESVEDRPTTKHENLYLLTKSNRNYWDWTASARPAIDDSGLRRYHTADPWFDSLNLTIAQLRHYLDHLEQIRDFGGLAEGDNDLLGLVSSVASFPGEHFAVFPAQLIEPLIKSGASPKVCVECGRPYERENIIIREDDPIRHTGRGATGNNDRNDTDEPRKITSVTPGHFVKQCSCPSDDTTPATVLDPFCGSGTTGQVCEKLGLNFIGLDLSTEYLAKYAAPTVMKKTTKAALKAAKKSRSNRKTKKVKEQLSLF